MTLRTRIDRLSPLWVGIAISGTLIAILLVTETVLGRWDILRAQGGFDPLARAPVGAVLRDLRVAIVHCLVMGYAPAAFLYVRQSGRRTVLALQEALGCTGEDSEDLAASVVRLSGLGLVITGLVGFAAAFSGPYNVPPVPETPWSPSTWSPEVAWHRILSPVFGWWIWWLGFAIITVSMRMSRLAKKLTRIDLLDLSPLAPFTRQGLTNALLLIGLLSIFSLMLLDSGFGDTILQLGVTTLVLAALAVFPPVRGVHTRIRQAKDVELRRIYGAIWTQRSALEDPDADRRIGEMSDLVAYRGLIENVPEWPLTASTYARLILYMLIPLASWVLGGIAEEIVGRALF